MIKLGDCSSGLVDAAVRLVMEVPSNLILLLGIGNDFLAL
jgi:hypothetical protein